MLTVFTIEQNMLFFLKRGLGRTYCFHHSYPVPFYTVGVADFADTKYMGKSIFECAYHHGDRIWMMPLLSGVDQYLQCGCSL